MPYAAQTLRLALALLGCAASASATLLLTATPPLGFNTFDSYGGLNHSGTVALADAMARQLKSHGYEYLVLCVAKHRCLLTKCS